MPKLPIRKGTPLGARTYWSTAPKSAMDAKQPQKAQKACEIANSPSAGSCPCGNARRAVPSSASVTCDLTASRNGGWPAARCGGVDCALPSASAAAGN